MQRFGVVSTLNRRCFNVVCLLGIFLAIIFCFDEVKREMILITIIYNVRVIHVEANLDLSNSPFALWNFADLAKF